jgi:hypothetical protein
MLPQAAQAAVSVSRAEVSGTKLRIEGSAAASRPITVDGVTMTTSSSSGRFRIERTGYTRPADCTVDVNDGGSPVNVRLAGCTVVAPSPTPTPTPAPTPTPTVAPVASLASVSLSPTTVGSGGTSAGVATLTSGAPSGGALVTVASSNPSVAAVPVSVTIPAGSTTGRFTVTTDANTSGSATISATYDGVTRTAVLTVTAASSLRITEESPLPTATVGENYAAFIMACCGDSENPYRWSLVTGTVPDGLEFAGDDLRLTRSTGVTGVPTRTQTTTFTVQVRDDAGNTDTKTFSITVNPANPLVITNISDQLADGQVGVAYEIGVFPGGGVPPYEWSHVGGTLPPGLFVQASPGRVKGTPTTAGSFTFTLRVDDSSGQFATRQFSILINP